MTSRHGRPLQERLLIREHRLAGGRGDRDGYPNLFLRTGVHTKILSELQILGPTAASDLSDGKVLRSGNMFQNLSSLVIQGLVAKYRTGPRRNEGTLYALRDDHPLCIKIGAILQALGQANGLTLPIERKRISPDMLLSPPTVREKKGELFGSPAHPIFTIFGTPNRTQAILLVAALGEVDKTTIAKFVGVSTDRGMMSLLDPIEGDALFAPSDVNQFVTYRLPDAVWSAPLHELAMHVCRIDPLFGSRVSATRKMLRSGIRRRQLAANLDKPEKK